MLYFLFTGLLASLFICTSLSYGKYYVVFSPLFVSGRPDYNTLSFPTSDCEKVAGDAWGWGVPFLGCGGQGGSSGLCLARPTQVTLDSGTPGYFFWAKVRLGGFGETCLAVGEHMIGDAGCMVSWATSTLLTVSITTLCSLTPVLVLLQLSSIFFL